MSFFSFQGLVHITCQIFLILFYFYLFIIFGCVGSSLLCVGFLQLRWVGATPRCGAWASHCGGLRRCGVRALESVDFSSCGAWAQQLWLMGSRAQAQQLWCMGPVAPWHVGSSRTRDWTRVPRTGRWIPNHCTTREAPTCQIYVCGVIFGSPLLSFKYLWG